MLINVQVIFWRCGDTVGCYMASAIMLVNVEVDFLRCGDRASKGVKVAQERNMSFIYFFFFALW